MSGLSSGGGMQTKATQRRTGYPVLEMQSPRLFFVFVVALCVLTTPNSALNTEVSPCPVETPGFETQTVPNGGNVNVGV